MPGLALLLLRSMLGATLITQGILYLPDFLNPSISIWLIAACFAITGAFFIVGALTSIAACFAIIVIAGMTVSILPIANVNLLGPPLITIYVIVTALAILLIGPGAFSLDALLFGRREINIPGKFDSTKS